MLLAVFLLLLFSAFKGGLATDEVCEEDLLDVCAPGITLPPPFPENEDEMSTTCSVLLVFVRCVKRYRESCPEAENVMQDVDTVHSVLKEVCRKTSFLNTVIVENLPCIKAVKDAQAETCSQTSRSVLGAHAVYLLDSDETSERQEVSMDKWRAHNCLIRLYDMACFVSNVFKSCGRVAKIAVMHVLNRIEFVQHSCTQEAMEELSPFLQDVELDTHEENVIKEILGLD